MDATPAKLRDGSWGARVNGEAPALGSTVTITTRAGKSWRATVKNIEWSSATRDEHLCVTVSEDRPTRGRTRSARAYEIRIGDKSYSRNASGRCEDAPCCGCCSI